MMNHQMTTIGQSIPQESFRFYYQTLSPAQQKLYREMETAFCFFQSQLYTDVCDHQSIFRTFHCLKMDVPELFFVSTVNVIRYAHQRQVKVIPVYRFESDDVSSLIKEANRRVEPLMKRIAATDSEPKKEQLIHDYLVKTVTYCDSNESTCYEAIGGLVYRSGVCEGIAKAVKWLCDRAGLRCIVVTGNAITTEGNNEPHAWNIIFIDGTPYHLDVTFDNTSTKDPIRYDYFNLSDAEIRSDHLPDADIRYPVCPKSDGWYPRKGQYFASKKQLSDYLSAQRGLNGVISFQLPDFGADNSEVIDAVQALLNKKLSSPLFRCTGYTLRCNPTRMVFEVSPEG